MYAFDDFEAAFKQGASLGLGLRVFSAVAGAIAVARGLSKAEVPARSEAKSAPKSKSSSAQDSRKVKKAAPDPELKRLVDEVLQEAKNATRRFYHGGTLEKGGEKISGAQFDTTPSVEFAQAHAVTKTGGEIHSLTCPWRW